MKKFLSFGLIALTGLILGSPCVLAKSSIYYTNNNGVSFTKDEYDFFGKMYYDGYQDDMTLEDKAMYDGFDMKAENVERVEYDEDSVKRPITDPSYSPKATVHETGSKKLSISKATNGYTNVAVTLQWKKNPSVRSYDVIGARLSNTTRMSTPVTKLTYSGGSYTSSNTIYPSGGFGTSIKLPSAGSSIKVVQTYTVTTGGTVYASYQHATSNVSLGTSQNYYISSAGYGSVFAFNSGINSYYDGMGGVYIGV